MPRMLRNRQIPLSFQERRGRRIPWFYIMIVLFAAKTVLLRHFFYGAIEWSGFLFEAASLVVILGLVELVVPAKAKTAVYWSLNLIYSVMLFAATVYFAHFGSVPTYTALYELHQVLQIKSSVQSTIVWSNYFYFLDFIAAILLWVVGRMRGRRLPAGRPVRKSIAALALIVCLGVTFRSVQLGLPIENELVEAESEGFLNYQVASAIKAAQDSGVAAEGNPDEIAAEARQLESSYPYSDRQGGTPAYFGSEKGKNVIVIQMEAFQNFPIHLSLQGQELTPVLNGLIGEGLYFPHMFQQIGQGNTSDAEFMSNTSIYPTAKIAMSTGYGDRQLPSLPRLLEQQNYEADTFHVNDVTFWDRDKLYPAIHFDHYFDKPSYNNDHFNSFGASDEELYRVGADKLSGIAKSGKPFYAQFVTVSSHFPFDVPEDRKRLKVPDSIKGTQLGDYLTAINYTDYAIGTFIDKLKAAGLWDNTVVVIYGDHFGLQPQDNDPSQIQSALGIHYDPKISRYNIPLIIHLPGETQGKVIETVAGQVDIMPTIANLLGISLKDVNYTAFGHDLLNIDNNVLGMRYYLPTGSFFNNKVLFVPGKGFDDGTAVSLDTLQPVADISPYRKDYDYVLKLMNLSDRYVRSLPKR